MLTLLQQYAQQDVAPVVQQSFARTPMDTTGIDVVMHERLDVAPSDYFRGYKSTISIVATNCYGTNHRSRYDVVELTIPPDAGGTIASSRDLVRPSPDSAFAIVLGIITIRFGERETCLFQVQFLRSAQRDRQQKWLVSKVLTRFPLIQYGTPHPQWLAVYPVVTLRAPALKIEDPFHANHFLLFGVQHMSRGLWESLPVEQERMPRHSTLQRTAGEMVSDSDCETAEEDW